MSIEDEIKNGVWAKLEKDEDGNIVAWNSLSAHSADVAASFEALLTRTILRKRFEKLLGRPLDKVDIARLSFLAAIHDAGKTNYGFQGKAFNSRFVGHVKPIVNIFAWEYDDYFPLIMNLKVDVIQNWFEGENDVVEFLHAVFCHHGKPVKGSSSGPNYFKSKNSYHPGEALKIFVKEAASWFPEAWKDEHQTFPTNDRFIHFFNGILTFADWLGSDFRFFKFAPFEEDQITRARKKAKIALDKLGLDPSVWRSRLLREITFDKISGWTPHDVQKKIVDLPNDVSGSLTTIESDTGSGKTEAAIFRFVDLFRTGQVDGMYFALPTRAAATQIHRRVVEAMKRCFGDDHPPVVLAVPGYMRVDDRDGEKLPHFNVDWNEDKPEEGKDGFWLRGWAAEQTKRYLLGTVVVGTIDQALLSGLRVKHAHMRAAGLARMLLVVDEVHASDVYMNKVLRSVLERQIGMDGHALLMSATLGFEALRLYYPRIGDLDLKAASHVGYPMVTYTDSMSQKPLRQATKNSGYEKTVRVSTLPLMTDADALAEVVVKHVKQGARVLVIRNTVGACMETLARCEQQLPAEQLLNVDGIPVPHHSRFAAIDRKGLDMEIEKAFGKGTARTHVAAIATQTVEQSLDIDADILITDLCPMDVLLQRIGRLQRHNDRIRLDAYKQAQCIILTPETRDLSSWIQTEGKFKGQVKGEGGLGNVYENLIASEATWQMIDKHDKWEIPKMNRLLVEAATHPEAAQIIIESDEKWKTHSENRIGSQAGDHSIASMNVLNWSKPFTNDSNKIAGSEEIVRTRLGDGGIDIQFPDAFISPFGNRVYKLTIPFWMLKGQIKGDDDLIAKDVNSNKQGIRFRVNEKQFEYTRLGFFVEKT